MAPSPHWPKTITANHHNMARVHLFDVFNNPYNAPPSSQTLVAVLTYAGDVYRTSGVPVENDDGVMLVSIFSADIPRDASSQAQVTITCTDDSIVSSEERQFSVEEEVMFERAVRCCPHE